MSLWENWVLMSKKSKRRRPTAHPGREKAWPLRQSSQESDEEGGCSGPPPFPNLSGTCSAEAKMRQLLSRPYQGCFPRRSFQGPCPECGSPERGWPSSGFWARDFQSSRSSQPMVIPPMIPVFPPNNNHSNVKVSLRKTYKCTQKDFQLLSPETDKGSWS